MMRTPHAAASTSLWPLIGGATGLTCKLAFTLPFMLHAVSYALNPFLAEGQARISDISIGRETVVDFRCGYFTDGVFVTSYSHGQAKETFVYDGEKLEYFFSGRGPFLSEQSAETGAINLGLANASPYPMIIRLHKMLGEDNSPIRIDKAGDTSERLLLLRPNGSIPGVSSLDVWIRDDTGSILNFERFLVAPDGQEILEMAVSFDNHSSAEQYLPMQSTLIFNDLGKPDPKPVKLTIESAVHRLGPLTDSFDSFRKSETESMTSDAKPSMVQELSAQNQVGPGGGLRLILMVSGFIALVLGSVTYLRGRSKT